MSIKSVKDAYDAVKQYKNGEITQEEAKQRIDAGVSGKLKDFLYLLIGLAIGDVIALGVITGMNTTTWGSTAITIWGYAPLVVVGVTILAFVISGFKIVE